VEAQVRGESAFDALVSGFPRSGYVEVTSTGLSGTLVTTAPRKWFSARPAGGWIMKIG
jgi:hypothetical protein